MTPAVLAWPFFGPSHAELAREARSWAQQNVREHYDESRAATDAACRDLVAAPGSAGFTRLDPDWAQVDRKTMSTAGRAVSSLIHTQGIGDLYRIYATAERDGVDYNLAFIPSSFNAPHKEEFDNAYMRALYDVGHDMALKGFAWLKTPPAFGY